MTVLHVVLGTVALAAAPLALLWPKRSVWHRRLGVAFTLAMSVVLFSAGFMWQEKGHLFLLPLAGVTTYLLFNGWRAVARRRRRRPDPIEDRIDMLAAAAAILAGVATAFLGVTAATPLLLSIKPALIGIGAVAAGFAINELLGFRSARTRSGWIVDHFASMIATYISAVTAFVVINDHQAPMILRWLVPSVAGGGTIVFLTLRELLRGRFGRSRRYNAESSGRDTVGPGRPERPFISSRGGTFSKS